MIIEFFKAVPIAVTLGITLAMSACGGSSNSAFPGGGGTGDEVPVIAIGPISGFGSVIVNGIPYNDSAAILQTELGNPISSSDLRLGMMVEVRGESFTTWGVADIVTTFSELKGVVEDVSVNGITVNGVRVALVDTTVYYEASSLAVGDQVEVYGVFDASRKTVVATRVERKVLANYKLRGVVSALDKDNEQFSIGSIRVSYNGLELPTNMINGVTARVYSNEAPGNGIWPVIDVRLANSSGSSGDRIEVEGIVSALMNDTISGQSFMINGFIVDATDAIYADGVAGDLAVGRRVEVKGVIVNDRLIAESIEFEDSMSSSSGEDIDESFRVTGLISRFNSIADFTVRGVVVDASQALRFDDGSVSDLSLGACVEIRGGLATGSAGSALLASRIKFEDEC